ncbi:MAG: tetratricopeptide repeat protein [Bacteroidota bacterium]
MKGLKSILYIIICSFVTFSCKKNSNNEGTFIPPLPNDIEFSKQKAALLLLNDEIGSNSSNPENYFKRANIYIQLNNLENAKSDIDEALALNANDGRYRLLKSEILREQGKYREALEEAKVTEILGLKTPEIYIILADLYQKNNQIEEAKKYFKYATEIAPFNGEVYYYQALLNVKLGDTTQAIENYNLAKQYKPRFSNSYKRLSEIYNNQGNTDLAMAITVELAKQYPDDAENCSILAKIYQKKQNIDSAIYFFQKAILLKPNMFQVSYDAGMMCLKNKYFVEAISFFENTHKFAPKTPFINTSLGMCHENLGDKDKALEYYTLGFAVNNRDYRAIEGIKRLEERMYYVEENVDNSDENNLAKNLLKKPKADTVRINLIEIQPKKIPNSKKDSSANKLSNKFPIPTIK